jgi:hypothetical protein
MSTGQSALQRAHGGPDRHGVPLYDFLSNSNARAPCPQAHAAVRQADASQYPDASYSALRQQLATFHGVAVPRIVLAASASEFIFRITAVATQQGGRCVWLPPHSYGDYAQAARAHRLALVADAGQAQLVWTCEPSSPLGAAQAGLPRLVDDCAGNALLVLDRAYGAAAAQRCAGAERGATANALATVDAQQGAGPDRCARRLCDCTAGCGRCGGAAGEPGALMAGRRAWRGTAAGLDPSRRASLAGLVRWETPRLCRGGSRSLTFTEVWTLPKARKIGGEGSVQRRNARRVP